VVNAAGDALVHISLRPKEIMSCVEIIFEIIKRRRMPIVHVSEGIVMLKEVTSSTIIDRRYRNHFETHHTDTLL
jgi:hypothetical protein